MGAFLDKPKTDKHNESGEGNGLRYGLASMQGWRVEMEDAHCAVTGMRGHMKDWSFFAVFDGHAGARASTYCAAQLLDAIVDTDDFRKIDADTAPSLEEVKNGMKEGFLGLDTRLRATSEVKNGQDKSGSTAVTVLLSPTAFFFANCGDSRAILIRNSKVEFGTEDHKPGNPNERERIVNAGGSVIIQRVNGSLAVSRALGDFEYKNVIGKGQCEQLVSPEPEITIVQRNHAEDQMIVLACDGVWDVMTNDELCSFLLNRMRISGDITEICNQVIDTCLYKGSRDNMSIVVVALNNAPKPDPECIAKEEALNESITRLTRQLFESIEDMSQIDLTRVLHRIGDELQSELPPGGGLAAKRLFIEEVYLRLHDEFSSKLDVKSCSPPNPIQSSNAARRAAAMSMGLQSGRHDHAGYSVADRINFSMQYGMELDSDESRPLNDEDDDALLLDRDASRDRSDAFNDDSNNQSANRYAETASNNASAPAGNGELKVNEAEAEPAKGSAKSEPVSQPNCADDGASVKMDAEVDAKEKVAAGGEESSNNGTQSATDDVSVN